MRLKINRDHHSAVPICLHCHDIRNRCYIQSHWHCRFSCMFIAQVVTGYWTFISIPYHICQVAGAIITTSSTPSHIIGLPRKQISCSWAVIFRWIYDIFGLNTAELYELSRKQLTPTFIGQYKNRVRRNWRMKRWSGFTDKPKPEDSRNAVLAFKECLAP